MGTRAVQVQVYRHCGRPIVMTPGVMLWLAASGQVKVSKDEMAVFVTDADGSMLGGARCPLLDPPDLALEYCIDSLGLDAALAIAYSGEPAGPYDEAELCERWAEASGVAAERGIHLLDWFMCGGPAWRSLYLTVGTPDGWLEFPPPG